MNKLIVPSIIVASGMVAAAALSQQATPPASGFQAKPYFQMPLEKDPSRVVRLQNVVIPPGAGNQFHRHPGDQWWAVQEGEVTFTVKGQQPKVMKAGDFVYVPRGTVHRNQNLSKLPARSIELTSRTRINRRPSRCPRMSLTDIPLLEEDWNMLKGIIAGIAITMSILGCTQQ